MLSNILKLAVIASLFAFIGCSTTRVDISATNKAKLPLVIKATSYDSDNTEKKVVELGRVTPEKNITGSIDVKHNGRIEVKAYLPDSASTDETSRTITSKDPNPFPYNIELSSNLRILDEGEVLTQLTKAFGELGPNVGYSPKKLDTALQNDLGALVVLILPKNGEAATPPLLSLGPGIFAPKVKREEIFWPTNNIDKKMQVIGSKTASLAVSAAIYGSLGIDTGSSDLFELNAKMSGFGIVQGAAWDYVEGIAKLATSHRNAIEIALASDPNAKLLYIDRMYVIQDAVFSRRKATKLNGSAKVNGASIVTATGAWIFEQNADEAGRFYESVVNIGGIEIPRNIFKTDPKGFKAPSPTIWPVYTGIVLPN